MFLRCMGVCAVILILILFYRMLRIKQWRRILKESIEYHKFHLESISRDPSANSHSRQMAHSLLWGVTKQLPLDLKDGKGGRALLHSFQGRKTSLNTCGTVFYECAKNHHVMDVTIFKLNDTLLSTIVRIFILESFFSAFGLIYFDLNLVMRLSAGSERGMGGFYLKMKNEINGRKSGKHTAV